VAFGAIFFLIYPLGLVWPSGWLWHGGEGKYYLQMICGVYAVLGAFLIAAGINGQVRACPAGGPLFKTGRRRSGSPEGVAKTARDNRVEANKAIAYYRDFYPHLTVTVTTPRIQVARGEGPYAMEGQEGGV